MYPALNLAQKSFQTATGLENVDIQGDIGSNPTGVLYIRMI